MGLTFSQAFGITLNGKEEWFDPCIWLDSPLSIDPFLMLDLEENDEFQGAHKEIIDFFQHQFSRVARAGTDLEAPEVRKIIASMCLPEAKELFLGYSEGTDGAGSGEGLTELMVKAMIKSISYGMVNVEHFEEISILGDKIGPDRISDAAGSITKWRFAKYTERICGELQIPTTKVVLDRARYDTAQERWVAVQATLPLHPEKKKPILLTPKRFLRHLPTLGADEFEVYATRQWKEQHRNALDKKIITFDKEKVIAEASKNPAIRKQFVAFAQQKGGKPYDFVGDKDGVTMPDVARALLNSSPFSFREPQDDEAIKAFVLELGKYFKHYIEQQKGWEMLWHGNRSKPEKAVQRLLFGIVFLICKANNISVDPETNAGRGPVDFKFSRGFNCKCLLEAKLARNTKWIQGATLQLPTYLTSDVCKHGVYLLVTYDGTVSDKVNKLAAALKGVASKGVEIDLIVVDASPYKLSASKLV